VNAIALLQVLQNPLRGLFRETALAGASNNDGNDGHVLILAVREKKKVRPSEFAHGGNYGIPCLNTLGPGSAFASPPITWRQLDSPREACECVCPSRQRSHWSAPA